jgi:hypothetical protein
VFLFLHGWTRALKKRIASGKEEAWEAGGDGDRPGKRKWGVGDELNRNALVFWA